MIVKLSERRSVVLRSHHALRQARRDAGTQVDLARAVGVTQQYVSKLEGGKDRDCSRDLALRISRYLGVAMENLFEASDALVMPTVTTDTRDGRKIA